MVVIVMVSILTKIYTYMYKYIQFARNFSCQERESRSKTLLNWCNGTSLADSHWELRTDTFG